MMRKINEISFQFCIFWSFLSSDLEGFLIVFAQHYDFNFRDLNPFYFFDEVIALFLGIWCC